MVIKTEKKKRIPGVSCNVILKNEVTGQYYDIHHRAYLRVLRGKRNRARYVYLMIPARPSKGIPNLIVRISIPVITHLAKILLKHGNLSPPTYRQQNILSSIEKFIYYNYDSSSNNSNNSSGNNNGNTNNNSNSGGIIDKKRVRDFLMGKRTAHTIWVDSDIWQRFRDILPPDKDLHWAIEQLMKEKLKEAENAGKDSAESAADV